MANGLFARNLEAEFPTLANSISELRGLGASDDKILATLQRVSANAIKSGVPVERVTDVLRGPTERPHWTENPLVGLAEAAIPLGAFLIPGVGPALGIGSALALGGGMAGARAAAQEKPVAPAVVRGTLRVIPELVGLGKAKTMIGAVAKPVTGGAIGGWIGAEPGEDVLPAMAEGAIGTLGTKAAFKGAEKVAERVAPHLRRLFGRQPPHTTPPPFEPPPDIPEPPIDLTEAMAMGQRNRAMTPDVIYGYEGEMPRFGPLAPVGAGRPIGDVGVRYGKWPPDVIYAEGPRGEPVLGLPSPPPIPPELTGAFTPPPYRGGLPAITRPKGREAVFGPEVGQWPPRVIAVPPGALPELPSPMQRLREGVDVVARPGAARASTEVFQESFAAQRAAKAAERARLERVRKSPFGAERLRQELAQRAEPQGYEFRTGEYPPEGPPPLPPKEPPKGPPSGGEGGGGVAAPIEVKPEITLEMRAEALRDHYLKLTSIAPTNKGEITGLRKIIKKAHADEISEPLKSVALEIEQRWFVKPKPAKKEAEESSLIGLLKRDGIYVSEKDWSDWDLVRNRYPGLIRHLESAKARDPSVVGADVLAADLASKGLIGEGGDAALREALLSSRTQPQMSAKEQELSDLLRRVETSDDKPMLVAMAADTSYPDLQIAAVNRLQELKVPITISPAAERLDLPVPVRVGGRDFAPEDLAKLSPEAQAKVIEATKGPVPELPDISLTKEPPRVEPTAFQLKGEQAKGARAKPVQQGLLGEEGPQAELPSERIGPKAGQTEQLTDLEKAGIPETQGDIFGGGKVKEARGGYGGGRESEYPLTAERPEPDSVVAGRFREFLKDSPNKDYSYASDSELAALGRTAKDRSEKLGVARALSNRERSRGFRTPDLDAAYDTIGVGRKNVEDVFPELAAERPLPTTISSKEMSAAREFRLKGRSLEEASESDLLYLAKTAVDGPEMARIRARAESLITREGTASPEIEEILRVTEPARTFNNPAKAAEESRDWLGGKAPRGGAPIDNPNHVQYDPKAMDAMEDIRSFMDDMKRVMTEGKQYGPSKLKLFWDWGVREKGGRKLWDWFATSQHIAREYPEYDTPWRMMRDALPRAEERAIDMLRGYQDIIEIPRKMAQKVHEARILSSDRGQLFTESELKSLGFNDEMVQVYNLRQKFWEEQFKIVKDDVADFLSQKWMRSGMSEGEAVTRARTFVEQKFRGMEVYEPHYRSGDLTVTVRRRGQPSLPGVVEGAPETGLVEFQMAKTYGEQAQALKKLQVRFPAEQGYEVKAGRLKDLMRETGADGIDLAALEILGRLAGVDPVIQRLFTSAVGAELQKRGFSQRYLQRENVPGFTKDLIEPTIRVTQGLFRYLERMKATDAAEQALAQIPQSKSFLIEHGKKMIEFANSTEGMKLEAFRNTIYLWNFALQMKQMIVQPMALIQAVWPQTVQLGFKDREVFGIMAKEIGRALNRKMPDLVYTQEQRWALDKGLRAGILSPRVETYMARPTGLADMSDFARFGNIIQQKLEERMTPIGKWGSKMRDWLMFPLAYADMKTRQVSFMTFYELAKMKGMNPRDASQFAIDETALTNGSFSKADRPEMFRSSGPIGKLGPVVSIMRMFTTNWLNQMRLNYKLAAQEAVKKGIIGPEEGFIFGPKGGKLFSSAITESSAGKLADIHGIKAMKTFERMLAASLAMGGLLYSPLGSVYRNTIGKMTGQDPEEAMREFLVPKLGQTAADVIIKGAPAALNMDLSYSLGTGDVIPDLTMGGLAGASEDFMVRFGNGLALAGEKLLEQAGMVKVGPEWREVADLLGPTTLRNIMRGYTYGTKGVETKRGGLITGGPIEPYEAGYQMAGIKPMSVSRAQSFQRALQQEESRSRLETSRITERIARAIVNQDNAALDRDIQKLDEINRKATTPSQMIQIDNATIRQRVAEMTSPVAAQRRVPKKFRGREEELRGLYDVPALPMP